jgi:transposase
MRLPVPRIHTASHRSRSSARHQWTRRVLAPTKKTGLCSGCHTTLDTRHDSRPRHVRDLSCGDRRVYLNVPLWRLNCPGCGVKTEELDWLASLPRYTRRFALFVGQRCRDSAVTDVAEELALDWQTVKELDKLYMAEQLQQAGPPTPSVIGIDEISVAARHKYRIVVSDLEAGRPIWFGGTDRSEASLDTFYTWLGPQKCRNIRLAVMDMWKAFRNSTLKSQNAPQAQIIYDKFHILCHLGKAIDQVRKQEYGRLAGDDRRYIKGK